MALCAFFCWGQNKREGRGREWGGERKELLAPGEGRLRPEAPRGRERRVCACGDSGRGQSARERWGPRTQQRRREDRPGRTPLHLAAYRGDRESVELLLQAKADLAGGLRELEICEKGERERERAARTLLRQLLHASALFRLLMLFP